MPLNVSLITFTPGTTIKSADQNSNLAALNTASINADSLAVIDHNSGSGVTRDVPVRLGVDDPSTYETPVEGQLWGDG